MEKRLVELIRAFQSSTARALGVVLAGTGLNHPFNRRAAGVPREGTLPGLAGHPPIRYSFHGSGLWVDLGDEIVDFDFGFDGGTLGFSEWLLWEYADGRAHVFPEFADQDRLEAAMDVARETGEILRPFRAQQDDLEYLASDIRDRAT